MKNIIFMDGEFAKLTPDGIDLISIGLVKPSGEELYLEIEFDGEIDPWVKKYVLPHMKGSKVSREEAVKKIKEFVGKEKPSLVAYVNQFDWMGICRLFGVKEPKDIVEIVPFHWVPIDFASILFWKGVEPGTSPIKLAKKLRINFAGLKMHNALDDAKLLKRIYEKVV
ncbi:MAG: 3'-5' exoribonuclease [Nanoarchaeota archaeon]|nr:3'-5' exoribonuclease [Nanoarchaeota archaeon]MBU0977606.1 3'-5' exoribonuclease [Nanoarchaeota archaeon]